MASVAATVAEVFPSTATASATATVAEVFPSTATASADKNTFGRPLIGKYFDYFDIRKSKFLNRLIEN